MENLVSRSRIALAVIFAMTSILPTSGQPPRAEEDPQGKQRAEIQKRLLELDSPCYESRRLAAEQMERWLGMPGMESMLAEQFQRILVQPESAFEVRWRVLQWRARLPLPKIEPQKPVSLEELEGLVRQLDDDSYAVRCGACERLKWMAASEPLAKPIVVLLHNRLADPSLSEDTYRRAESIRNIAWGMWLTRDEFDWHLPAVSGGQIAVWLDELEEPASIRDMRAALRRRAARQELLDVLSQDRETPRMRAALEARLRGKLSKESALRLRELLDLTRPALVAECWSGHKQVSEEHLALGEAVQLPGGERATLFDRADDRMAHCVSGNALAPGTYPVGIAFAPPNRRPDAVAIVFHLVNLPTPRRQIAYSYYVKTDRFARLETLSRRTLNRFLSEVKLLNDADLEILGQLDAGEVSRFASHYFLLVEDGMVEEDFDQDSSTVRKGAGSQSSRFGAICAQLANDGTREAVPGLLSAIRQKRFHPPASLGTYRLQWLAALSIARRDPWPGVDAWLAETIDNSQTIVIEHDEWGHWRRRPPSNGDNPQTATNNLDATAGIGATAAGLLLARHRERPEAFGLQAAVDPLLAELRLPGFRYGKPDDAQRIHRWWNRQNETGKTKPATILKPT